MPWPESVEDLADVKLWIADHDARGEGRAAAQDKWNAAHEEQLRVCETMGREVRDAVAQINNRLAWWAGAAAAFGALAGSLSRLFLPG